jgi:hypothetical protein
MVERGEADDNILAVLLGDPTYGEIIDVSQLPRPIIDRLRHYFLTYKPLPGDAPNPITVDRCMTRWQHVAFSRRRGPTMRMPFPTDAFGHFPHLVRRPARPFRQCCLARSSDASPQATIALRIPRRLPRLLTESCPRATDH